MINTVLGSNKQTRVNHYYSQKTSTCLQIIIVMLRVIASFMGLFVKNTSHVSNISSYNLIKVNVVQCTDGLVSVI